MAAQHRPVTPSPQLRLYFHQTILTLSTRDTLIVSIIFLLFADVLVFCGVISINISFKCIIVDPSSGLTTTSGLETVS